MAQIESKFSLFSQWGYMGLNAWTWFQMVSEVRWSQWSEGHRGQMVSDGLRGQIQRMDYVVSRFFVSLDNFCLILPEFI